MANNCWIGYENMVVGEARAERNIIYTSTGAGVSFHHHVRGNEHAKRAAIRPGESIEMRRNVIAAGPSTWDGTGLVQFTNALKEKGDVFERPFDGYRAEGNWYFHPGVRRFKYVVEIDKVDEMLDLAGWKRKWGERERDALWVDPGFVDPERCDFRLRPGSPLAGREAEYLIWRMEEARIEEMKRFLTWATTDCQVEPYETIPAMVALVMGL